MGGLPDLIVVIDTNKEALAIKEAQRLGIPVAAILDSNCDPEGITYPVPGNDDAGRAIALYCDLIARAALDGIGRSQGAAGQDIGASENPFIPELQQEAASVQGGALERLTAPRGTADDLSKLPGVGPALEKKLNDYGIFHYWQVAGLNDADVAAVDAELKLAGRIQRDGWVAQAGSLAE
jgi:small subunit ribosomal protein S2